VASTIAERSDAPADPGATAPRALRSLPSAMLAHARAPYVVAGGWYAIFIARASFTIGGRRSFSLFDDAMISMTYARNLAHGHGLVWNPGGPRVEGITNLAWTLVLSLVHVLPLPDRLMALPVQLLGVAILFTCAATARRIVVTIAPHRHLAATAAPWLVLTCYPLVYWTLRGMEVGFLTMLLLVATLGCLRATAGDAKVARRGATVAGAACALGTLTRLDFAVFVVVLALWCARHVPEATRRPVLLRLGAWTAASILGQEIFRRIYYRAWVPNTYALKVGNIALTNRLSRGTEVVAFTAATSLLFAIAFALRARRAHRRDLDLILGLALVGAGYCAFVGGDAWEWMRYADRYLAPVAVLVLLAAAIGVDAAFEHAPSPAQLRRLLPWVGLATATIAAAVLLSGHRIFGGLDDSGVNATVAPVVAIIGLTLLALATRRREPRQLSTRALIALLAASASAPALLSWASSGAVYAAFDAQHARVGVAVRSVTDTDARVAVSAAGSVIYFAHRDGVDILGKMDPRIANEPIHPGWFFWPGHSKWDYTVTLAERPDLIVDPWTQFKSDVELIRQNGYRNVQLRRDSRNPAVREAATSAVGIRVLPDSPHVDHAQLETAP
jgi:hypothetical protein